MNSTHPSLIRRTICLAMLLPLYIYMLPGQTLTVQSGMSADSVLNTLFGAGVTVSNVVLTCDTAVAMGTFQNGMSGIGLSDGILISTGNVQQAVGPNSGTATSTALGGAGDADLSSLISGFPTFDACVISFDIVSVCDTIVIQYVFASEEYPEFVGTSFNDVFGFFISGPGYAGVHNMATLPMSSQAVAINTVNPVTNANLYVDNTSGTDVEYDGFTVPMLAYAAVVPDSTYQLKLAVGDAADQVFDSSVFLKREGVCANPGLVQLRVANQAGTAPVSLAAGESEAILFRRALPASQATAIYFSAGGDAQAGMDYLTLPDSIVIAAGETEASLMVESLVNCNVPGAHNLVIHYADGTISCAGTPYSDSLAIEIVQTATSPLVSAGSDTLFCSGESVQLGVPGDTGLVYSWSGGTGFSDPTIPQPMFAAVATDSVETYVLEVMATNNAGCSATDEVAISIYPEAVISGTAPDTFLLGQQIEFDFLSTEHAESWTWSFGDGGISNMETPSYTYTDTGVVEIELRAGNPGGAACEARYAKTIYVNDPLATSISANEVRGFRMFPNPARDFMRVELDGNEPATLRIYSLAGKLVLQRSDFRGRIQLSTASLPPGLYMVQVQLGGRFESQKLQIR